MASTYQTMLSWLEAQFTKFAGYVKTYVGTKVQELKSGLKLEDLSDVEASATEVNLLKGATTAVKDLAPLASPELSGIPTAPTAGAGTNTTQIATTAFVKDAVDTAVSNVKADLGSALTYKGSVATYEELPKSEQSKGDTYNVVAAHGNTPAGTNYAWDGEKWDPLGGDIDLSAYALTATVNTELGKKLDASVYNSEKEGFETTQHASQTYQPKGEYFDAESLEDIQDSKFQAMFA